MSICVYLSKACWSCCVVSTKVHQLTATHCPKQKNSPEALDSLWSPVATPKMTRKRSSNDEKGFFKFFKFIKSDLKSNLDQLTISNQSLANVTTVTTLSIFFESEGHQRPSAPQRCSCCASRGLWNFSWAWSTGRTGFTQLQPLISQMGVSWNEGSLKPWVSNRFNTKIA